MPGPPPKPPEERRRRNKPAAGEWRTLPATPYEGDKPKMPSGLGSPAKRTWQAWWSSPIAHELGPNRSFWMGLERLILLIDAWYKAGADDTKMLAEIRQHEDRFGLSPKGMQQLRLRYQSDEDAAVAAAASGSSSRYSGLRLVENG